MSVADVLKEIVENIEGVFNGLISIVNEGISYCMDKLDICPFPDMLASFESFASGTPYLGWINWIVPIGGLVAVLGAWLAAIAIYYMVSIVLRWVKAIQ